MHVPTTYLHGVEDSNAVISDLRVVWSGINNVPSEKHSFFCHTWFYSTLVLHVQSLPSAAAGGLRFLRKSRWMTPSFVVSHIQANLTTAGMGLVLRGSTYAIHVLCMT